MRAFITGINGFAGVHLARELLAAGDRVAGCTRFGELEGVDASVEFALAWDMGQGNFSDAARQQFWDYAPEAIYHLAALSIPSRCGKIEPTPEAVQSNVEGTRELLEVCGQLSKRPRILFTSSSHVYAAVTKAMPYCQEDSPCDPASAYGKTKLAAEHIVCEAVQNGSADVVIARAFHHTGPGQLPPGMVPTWTQQLLDPAITEMNVVTLGANLDVTDVRDVVAAYRILAERGRAGEAYNIGSGRGHSGHEIMRLLMERAGVHKPVTEKDPSPRQNPLADCDKIERETAWRARISLTQTLDDTLAFWRSVVK